MRKPIDTKIMLLFSHPSHPCLYLIGQHLVSRDSCHSHWVFHHHHYTIEYKVRGHNFVIFFILKDFQGVSAILEYLGRFLHFYPGNENIFFLQCRNEENYKKILRKKRVIQLTNPFQFLHTHHQSHCHLHLSASMKKNRRCEWLLLAHWFKQSLRRTNFSLITLSYRKWPIMHPAFKKYPIRCGHPTFWFNELYNKGEHTWSALTCL